MPKISVVVPVYGVEKFIHEAVDSILNQTLNDIEIILVDDGSLDNCPQIIDDYARTDSRVKAIHQTNGGYGKAVNTGIANATGEFIGIVEPDDYLEHNMYEELYNHAEQLDLDVCTSGFYKYDSQAVPKKRNKKWKHPNENIEKFPNDKAFTINEYPELFMIHASLWSKIYRKSFIDECRIRLNETRSASYQDFPFMAEVMCKAKRIGVLSKYFYHWRVESNQNSSTSRKDKRLMIMADQCEEVKRIVKATGHYNILKNAMYRHFFSANYGFYRIINNEYRKEYFSKIHNLFKELSDDESYNFTYLTAKEKRILEAFINNNY